MGLTRTDQVIDAPNGQGALGLSWAWNEVARHSRSGRRNVDGLGSRQAQIRHREESLPIVVLSSRGDEAGKVAALDLGADDYVTEPFGMDELLARLRAAFATSFRCTASGRCSRSATRRRRSGAPHRQRVSRRSELAPEEYELLRLLVQHVGKVLTHRLPDDARRTWDDTTDPQYLRVYVRQLRRKIEADPERPRYLLTETGIG